MPRIRSLKPEHRQHRKVGSLSHRQYRLWVGMICEADDEGRLVADPEQLRATIFGYHPDVSAADLRQDLSRLAKIGLIRAYRCHGTDYACFPDWRDHQRIDKPKPSKLPAYTVRDRSKTNPGAVADESTTPPGRVLPDRKGSEGIKDLIGSEGKGGERGGKPNVLAHQDSEPTPNGVGSLAPGFADLLAGIKARHPELADVEAEQAALREVSRGARQR